MGKSAKRATTSKVGTHLHDISAGWRSNETGSDVEVGFWEASHLLNEGQSAHSQDKRHFQLGMSPTPTFFGLWKWSRTFWWYCLAATARTAKGEAATAAAAGRAAATLASIPNEDDWMACMVCGVF